MVETREDTAKRKKRPRERPLTAAKCAPSFSALPRYPTDAPSPFIPLRSPPRSLVLSSLSFFLFLSLLPLQHCPRCGCPYVKPNHFQRVTDISYYVYIAFSGIGRLYQLSLSSYDSNPASSPSFSIIKLHVINSNRLMRFLKIDLRQIYNFLKSIKNKTLFSPLFFISSIKFLYLE